MSKIHKKKNITDFQLTFLKPKMLHALLAFS